MKVNPVNVKINDLIDEHNKVHSFAECPGCDICQQINNISKTHGLWIENSEIQRQAKARAQRLKKEEVKRQLDAGRNQKEIANMFNVSEQVIGRKIKKWFPGYQRFKKIEISLEEYESLLEKGVKKRQIAERFNTDYNVLTYHIKKLRRMQKSNV